MEHTETLLHFTRHLIEIELGNAYALANRIGGGVAHNICLLDVVRL